MGRNEWLTVMMVLGMAISSAAQDATEIIRNADRHLRGETQYSEMTMTLERPDWTRSISMKVWMKGLDYSLILITAPARDEGTAFLKRGNEVWNWLPAVENVIKIPPSMMTQSWMGSDFTNDDLVKESSIVMDYDHTIVAEETIRGYACWKIELIPHEDAAVVWGKLYIWVAKDVPNQLRIEYYDEMGELVNIMTLEDIKMMDDREIPTRLIMEPVDKPGHRTIMVTETIEFNRNIPQSFFSEQNMKRVR